MNNWELLGYYEESNIEFEALQQWNALGKKQLHNIESSFHYARQPIKLLQEFEIVQFDSSVFIYHANGWQKSILDGIRLGLFESLKEHHKNRRKVEEILNTALTDDWIKDILKQSPNINDLKRKIKEIISEKSRNLI